MFETLKSRAFWNGWWTGTFWGLLVGNLGFTIWYAFHWRWIGLVNIVALVLLVTVCRDRFKHKDCGCWFGQCHNCHRFFCVSHKILSPVNWLLSLPWEYASVRGHVRMERVTWRILEKWMAVEGWYLTKFDQVVDDTGKRG